MGAPPCAHNNIGGHGSNPMCAGVVVDVTVCSGTHSSVHQTPYRDSDHLIVHTVFPTGPYRPGIT